MVSELLGSSWRSPLTLVMDPMYWMGLPIALIFGGSGYLHLTQPYPYCTMMRGMPFPSLHPSIVYWSGWVELGVAGACFLQPSSGLFTGIRYLTLAITPANINMWYNNAPFGDVYFTPQQHVLRGAVQVVLLVWVWGLERVYESRIGSPEALFPFNGKLE